jgi:hypothetical protein
MTEFLSHPITATHDCVKLFVSFNIGDLQLVGGRRILVVFSMEVEVFLRGGKDGRDRDYYKPKILGN